MTNVLLFGATVLIWGTTWIAIKYQVGLVPESVSVAYRFALAAVLIFLWVWARRLPLRFAVRDHAFMAGQGLCIFSTNFYLFYRAAEHLTSGLLAVIFSLAVVMNIVNGAIFLRVRPDLRTLLGAACGLLGMTVVFWPEFAGFSLANASSLAVLTALAATYSFSLGNIVALRNQKAGLPVLPSSAYGMAYGAAAMALLALISGEAFLFDPRPAYVGSLLYLALFGSVLAFACYLVLLGRIGAGRSAYVTVLFPIIALALSTVFEDFTWTTGATAGVALILFGNVLVLVKPGKTVATKPKRSPTT